MICRPYPSRYPGSRGLETWHLTLAVHSFVTAPQDLQEVLEMEKERAKQSKQAQEGYDSNQKATPTKIGGAKKTYTP